MPFTREEQGESWGSDSPISEPVPAKKELKITFDGFGFTMGGMTFDVAQEDIDDLLRPIYQPDDLLDDDEPILLIDDQWRRGSG